MADGGGEVVFDGGEALGGVEAFVDKGVQQGVGVLRPFGVEGLVFGAAVDEGFKGADVAAVQQGAQGVFEVLAAELGGLGVDGGIVGEGEGLGHGVFWGGVGGWEEAV